MGVMGRVRRHCDAVTAFMFQPKAQTQDPRDNPSDPSDQRTEILKANICCYFARFYCYYIASILCTNRGLNCILGVLSLRGERE